MLANSVEKELKQRTDKLKTVRKALVAEDATSTSLTYAIDFSL